MLRRALGIFEKVQNMVSTIAVWCAYAAAAGILFIVALLVVSSTKRYLFQEPIHVTEELGGLLFLGTTFLGLTFGFVRNRHVRLELLWRYLPYPWRQLLEVLGYVLCTLALLMLIHQTWAMTAFSFELQARSVMTELLLWPWRLLMPAMLSLLMLAMVVRALVTLLRVAVGERPPEAGVTSPSDIAAV
jgi:TRAP-type C4-dicarboxylate transport system permease small subunit